MTDISTEQPRAHARIVYLGGLGDTADQELSPHLASRHEVGQVLASGSVPVTELRAAADVYIAAHGHNAG